MSSDLSIGHTVVCIPARNEGERIGCLLTSLALQSVASAMYPLKVVILSNNTDDNTAAIVRDFASYPTLSLKIVEIALPPNQAHAGTARKMAMDIGADWLDELSSVDGVILSTDADAIAPVCWVGANLAALADSEIVGGRLVIVDDEIEALHPNARLNCLIDRYWAAVRDLEDCLDPQVHDPAPRHGDHTGASLALRVSTYRHAGGVPPISSGEDNALVAAIERNGGRIRHCPNVWIGVSSREQGRASGGMATEMTRRRFVSAGQGTYELPTAVFWRDHILRRAVFRSEWANDTAFYNSIAYVAHRQATIADPPPPVQPIDEAIAALEAMTKRRRPGHAA